MLPTLAALILGSPALAGPDASTDPSSAPAPTLADLLGAYEEVPSAAQLQALGPDVSKQLMALALDPAVPPSRRSRAVTALGHLPGDAERAFLLARLEGDDPLLQRKAAWALATAYGDDAVAPISTLLAHDDAHTREAAIRALGTLKGPAAREALEARRPLEREAHVLHALDAALGATETPR